MRRTLHFEASVQANFPTDPIRDRYQRSRELIEQINLILALHSDEVDGAQLHADPSHARVMQQPED